MILKNYTSAVPSGVTINRIQGFLIKAGVASLSMDYGLNGETVALTFAIQIEANKRPVMIRLPANVEGAHEALWLDYIGTDRIRDLQNGDKETAYPSKKRLRRSSFKDQAERTAWRLTQDWIEVQLSMVQLKQADFMQVFLPYTWDGKQSFYQRIKGGGFLALEQGKPQESEAEIV